MFTDHIDISEAFVQGELLPGDGHNVNVCISLPGCEKDHLNVYRKALKATIRDAICCSSVVYHHERFISARGVGNCWIC